MPALVLIHSLIDSFAWAVAGPENKDVRGRFVSWLEKYVYPYETMPCTSLELYAARCAVLHTMTSKSDLHVRGANRQFAYAWGPAKREALDFMTSKAGLSSQFVGIHIDHLLAAVGSGIRRTLEAANLDAELAKKLGAAAPLHYKEMSRKPLEAYYQSLGKAGEK